jgi:ABC-2 type transport system permease protein
MRTIIHLVIKEFLQLKRDPKLFGIVFLAPVLQLIFLGYAANMDINSVSLVVFDMDKSYQSRMLIEDFRSSGYFEMADFVNSYDELTEYIDYGKAVVGIVIPKDFEKKINRKDNVKLQAVFDGSDGNKASIASGYVQALTASRSKSILLEQRDKSGIILTSGSVIPETRVWYNPDLKTRNFMVPSIMGLILMVITTVLMSMAIVKEREIGTLEQIIVTPIKPYQLIIGKLIPFAILGFIDILLVTGVMVIWFGIGIRGDFFFLLAASLIFILSTLGLGLFISTISKTQQQAMLVAQFGLMMPMIYLSGFAFPVENMPTVIQWITHIIPLKYYLIILRDVILKGSGFYDLILQTLILFLMGLLILFLSALRFKKRLE